MWDLSIVFLLLMNLNSIYGQFSYGCPAGWEVYGTQCYLFEKDDKRIFEEADAACWVNGATLLSVNEFNEHDFVSKWLVKHDLHFGTVWLTSGLYSQGILVWDGDSTLGTPGVDFWSTVHPPGPDSLYTRIAYIRGGPYGVDGYNWQVVSESIAYAYICEMSKLDAQERKIEERDFTYGQNTTDIQAVQRGPVMAEQPRSVVVFGDPPTVFIECKAKANPVPSYSWRRDQDTAVTSLLDNRYTLSAGRFTIQGPKTNIDNGDYQCMIENRFGKILSDPAQIIFGYLQSFSPVKPEDVFANKFEGSRISCQAPAAFPDKAFSWFYNSINEPVFRDHQNMFVSSSGYLYFSSVQPTDQRKYYCSVTLIASSQYDTAIDQPPSRISLGVNLVVTGTEHGYFKPFIYTHTFPSPPLRGAQIRLECVAYGSLPLEYSWRRVDGRDFEPGTKLTDKNRVLIIEDATIQAEGIYVCTVNGRAGVTSKNITLFVEAKPYFPFGIGNRLVDPGQTFTWRCKAVARPTPQYSWYKDGELIKNIPGRIEVYRDYVRILNVDAQRDEGMYQCGATNVHGTTFSYGQLKVLSFEPTFDKNPMVPYIQIPLGGNYTLPCKVEAAPVPEVVWLKNGAPLSLTPGIVDGHLGMTFENDLVFNGIDSSDQGSYTCKATNVNGGATNTTSVNVVRGIAISNPPLDTRVQVNNTAFMFCQVSYDSLNFDLTYQWRINGHLLDLENDPHFLQSKKNGLDGLYILNAQFKHTGVYTCDARTTIHVDSKSADLYVDGPPGAPAGAYVVSASVTSDSVRLIWTISSDINHGNPITSYDVEAELGIYPGVWNPVATDILEFVSMNEAINFGLREDQRSAVITGLLPDIAYSFRVRAINGYGRGHEASMGSVSVKTPARAPVTVPKNVRGFDEGKVGTLNIVWDPLDISEYSGPGVGYNVYFRKKDDPREWFHVKVHGAESSMYTHLVGIDNFYLEYAVKIGAFNAFGSGPNSTVHIIMSAEGMPIATVLMEDCDNYNESAFSMAWQPVEDTREVMKGKLKGYRVRYWHSDYPDFVMWRDLYGQQDSTVIIGLEDNTNYWASVQVMNYAGVGPIGEIRLAETFHLAPIDYPRHVKVWPHAQHSVRVTWQGISTMFNQESLQGYILRVWKIQADIRTARDVVVDKVREAVIEGLQTHTVYVLRMLGYSVGGDGSLSPHVYFTVEGGNVPFDPTTTRFCFAQDACDSSSTLHISLLLTVVLPFVLSVL